MKRVLVIEDEQMVRDVCARILERAGYFVALAENGKEGLRLFNESPFDLVITDIFMPEMDGLEFIRQLRRIEPSVKLVAMSGGGRHEDFEALRPAMHMGAARILVKPFDKTDLLKVVEDVLDVEKPPAAAS